MATDIESIAIDIAGKSHVILFDEDTTGTFMYGADTRTIGTVRKIGACWSGPKVEFCAPR